MCEDKDKSPLIPETVSHGRDNALRETVPGFAGNRTPLRQKIIHTKDDALSVGDSSGIRWNPCTSEAKDFSRKGRCLVRVRKIFDER